MKKEIQTVKAALAGLQATTPTSRMCKVQENRLWAYGGAFCLSVPIESSLDCGFMPDPVLAFFSKEREGATFTEQDNVLILKHDGFTQRTPILKAQQIPALQTIGRKLELPEPLRHLQEMSKIARSNANDFTQGIWFQQGMIFGMLERLMVFSIDGLPEGFPDFGIPIAAFDALAKIPSPIIHFVADQQSVQFEFENGVWLSSRKLVGLSIPNLMIAFENAESTHPLEFDPEVVKEIRNFKLHGEKDGVVVDMIWHAKDGNLSFMSPDGSEGEFEDACVCDEEFSIKGESLRMVLALETEQLEIVKRNSYASSLNGYSDGFAVAACLMRL